MATARSRGPGRWELIAEVGRDPLTGRRKQRSKMWSGVGQKAADRAAVLYEAEQQESNGQGTDATMADLFARWLEVAGPNLAPRTLYTYENYLKNRIKPALGRRKVAKLTTADLDAFYAALGASGMKANSVRRVHAIIRRALWQAERWGWIDKNPAANATLPRPPHRELEVPAPDDVQRIIIEAERTNPDLAMFLFMAARTGARRGELCGLRWTDIRDGTLTIARAISEVPHKPLIVKDTKTHQERTLALDKATVARLALYKVAQNNRAVEAGGTLHPRAYVFSAAPDGSEPWKPKRATQAFRRIVKRLKIDARLHDLRHFLAAYALLTGSPVRTVSGRLGHADASVTLNVYGKFIAASDQSLADAMGDLLDAKEPHSLPPAEGTTSGAGDG